MRWYSYWRQNTTLQCCVCGRHHERVVNNLLAPFCFLTMHSAGVHHGFCLPASTMGDFGSPWVITGQTIDLPSLRTTMNRRLRIVGVPQYQHFVRSPPQCPSSTTAASKVIYDELTHERSPSCCRQDHQQR